MIRSRVFLFVIACCLSASALADVTASLDRDEVSEGDTVQLTLQHEGRTGSEPDLSPLQRDFDILGRSSSSSIQIVNGHISSQTQLQLQLSPKHGGRIEIPPLTWDGERSQPLQLTVDNGSGGGGGGSASGAGASGNGIGNGSSAGAHASHVFITSSFSPNRPYVQAAVILTVQVHTDQPLYQASLDLPGSGDVVVQQLGKDQHDTEMRNGRSYQVIQRKYLLQPQRSGKVELDGPVLDAQIGTALPNLLGSNSFFQNFFGNNPFAGMTTQRPLRLHGEPIDLDVRPRPAAWTGRDWLPAHRVTLDESWKPDSVSTRVGDPLVRHLSLRVVGQTGAQLPDLSKLLDLPPGLKAYPDQAKLDTYLQNDQALGTREQDIAIIASRPGHYALPPIRVAWWDVDANQQREAVLPGRTLAVVAAPGTSGGAATAAPPAATSQSAPPAAAQPGGSPASPAPAPAAGASSRLGGTSALRNPWLWFAVAFAVLWLVTLALWWFSDRRRRDGGATPPAKPAEAQARGGSRSDALKTFRQACERNDARAAREALMRWARLQWPQDPPSGLNELARRLREPQAATALRELDRACYVGGDWQGAALLKAFKPPAAPAADAGSSAGLANLYP